MKFLANTKNERKKSVPLLARAFNIPKNEKFCTVVLFSIFIFDTLFAINELQHTARTIAGKERYVGAYWNGYRSDIMVCYAHCAVLCMHIKNAKYNTLKLIYLLFNSILIRRYGHHSFNMQAKQKH